MQTVMLPSQKLRIMQNHAESCLIAKMATKNPPAVSMGLHDWFSRIFQVVLSIGLTKKPMVLLKIHQETHGFP